MEHLKKTGTIALSTPVVVTIALFVIGAFGTAITSVSGQLMSHEKDDVATKEQVAATAATVEEINKHLDSIDRSISAIAHKQ